MVLPSSRFSHNKELFFSEVANVSNTGNNLSPSWPAHLSLLWAPQTVSAVCLFFFFFLVIANNAHTIYDCDRIIIVFTAGVFGWPLCLHSTSDEATKSPWWVTVLWPTCWITLWHFGVTPVPGAYRMGFLVQALLYSSFGTSKWGALVYLSEKEVIWLLPFLPWHSLTSVLSIAAIN